MRPLERRGHAHLCAFEPAARGVGVEECNFWRHRRIERPMDGDQVVLADELVKLDIMHMAALADLRCMNNGEHVVAVDVDLGHVIAIDTVPHGDRVEAEHMGQNIHSRLVANWDIYPNDGVLTFEQPWEFRNLMSLDTRITDEQDIHNPTAFHALDSIHAPWAPRMSS